MCRPRRHYNCNSCSHFQKVLTAPPGSVVLTTTNNARVEGGGEGNVLGLWKPWEIVWLLIASLAPISTAPVYLNTPQEDRGSDTKQRRARVSHNTR